MPLSPYLTYARSAITGKPFPQKKPERIQFPVNDICNARCAMCNIWHQKRDKEISVAEIRAYLRDPLFSEVSAVGINGGEPTLRGDLADIVHALADELPSLKALSIITNGLHRTRARTAIQAMSKAARERGKLFHVMTSLDGVGPMHDYVRGRSGNFANVDGLLTDIQEQGLADTLQIGCTVIHQNVYGIHELLDYAVGRGIYIKYRLGVPHRRLYKPRDDTPFTLGKTTWPDIAPFDLSDEERTHFAQFLLNLNKHYETSLPQQWFYRSLVGQLIDDAPRQAGCAWRNAGVTLTSRGELAYCAVESDVLGDLSVHNASDLYWGGHEHLEHLHATKCASCSHDYGGMPEGRALRSYAWERVRKTQRAARHLAQFKSSSLGQAIVRIRAERSHEHLVEQVKQATVATPVPRGDGRRVLICGWYGTETAGDKGILAGIVGTLRQQGASHVSLVSFYPDISRLTVAQMPELAGVEVIALKDAAAHVDSAGLVAFGGGPLMAIPRLASLVGIFERATQRRVPTLVAGCGVGPLGAADCVPLVRRLLAAATIRIYRDAESRVLAAQLGIDTATDEVAEDPAFTWIAHLLPTLAQPAPARRDRLLLGLRDWPFGDYASHLDKDAAYQAKQSFDADMVAAVERFAQRHPEVTIMPIPMCTNSYGGDDRFYYIDTLQRSAALAGRLDTSLLGREPKPADYIHEFRRARLAVTMRFHSLVFAIASGTPAIAVDYTLGKGKVDSLARKMNVPSFGLSSIDWPAFDTALDASWRASATGQTAQAPAPATAFESALRRMLPPGFQAA